MSVLLNYIAVIIIWSTTPLAIKWSNDSIAPIASISLRTLIAAACALVLMALWRRADFLNKHHYKSYFVASLGLFPNMPLVYYAAQTIPSGLISVLFGLVPFFTALFSYFMLSENSLTPRRMMAQLLALLGLMFIAYDQLILGEQAFTGVLLMLASAVLYAFSNVWLKKLSLTQSVPAFDLTTGALMFSLPGLLLSWYAIEGSFSVEISRTSALSLGYLAVVGSLLGFAAFYRLLNQLSVGLVSLIPVITPVVALYLGVVLAGEVLTLKTMAGVVMIITGLILYEGIPRPLLIGIARVKWLPLIIKARL